MKTIIKTFIFQDGRGLGERLSEIERDCRNTVLGGFQVTVYGISVQSHISMTYFQTYKRLVIIHTYMGIAFVQPNGTIHYQAFSKIFILGQVFSGDGQTLRTV